MDHLKLSPPILVVKSTIGYKPVYFIVLYIMPDIDIYLFEQFFEALRATIKIQISDVYKDYISYVQALITNDSKYFWNFINQKNGTSRLSPCLTFNDTELSNPMDIVNALLFLSTRYVR